MSDTRNLPVIRTWAEADAHDHETPALVELPGRWIRSVVWLRDRLMHTGPEGMMARAVEALLAGLVERESSLIMMGLTDATMIASQLVRSPDAVLQEAITDERKQRRGVYVLEVPEYDVALDSGFWTEHNGDDDDPDTKH